MSALGYVGESTALPTMDAEAYYYVHYWSADLYADELQESSDSMTSELLTFGNTSLGFAMFRRRTYFWIPDMVVKIWMKTVYFDGCFEWNNSVEIVRTHIDDTGKITIEGQLKEN